ncbi:Cof-type HAD-IIB family hydrolase [Streptobacillus moniliformis]|uniref:Cof-type HAD-IIB family hydrolase n=1 Tax=Streptobacillus moniliformis TaxID=34105 RepID=UPI0007E464AD|nr:HAD family hydrolase [Streptobacillus moniliformis]
MKDKIKLIAIDFDGTFLDDSHFKQDLSYVDKLREKNLNQEIVFASGRATAGIVELIKRLKMTDIVRYIIGHNGAEIFDLKENKIIYQECMEDDVVFNIIEILEKNGFNNPLSIHDWNKFYTYKNSEEYEKMIELEQRVNFVDLINIDDVKCFPENKIKLMIFTKDKVEQEGIYNLISSEFNDKVTQARSAVFLNELTKKGINKAKGLEFLCSKLDIDLNEVLAFGNAENDIDMLLKVGYGFAMKNSEEILLEKIKRVTKYTNNEFGVEREIIDFLGI